MGGAAVPLALLVPAASATCTGMVATSASCNDAWRSGIGKDRLAIQGVPPRGAVVMGQGVSRTSGQANVRALSAPSAEAKVRREAAAAAAAVAARQSPRTPTPLAAMGQMPVSFRAGGASRASFRVLCYGDSLTVGFFDNGRQYEPYGRTLADALAAAAGGASVEVLVCGQSGHTAADMVRNLDAQVVEDVGGLLSKGLRRALAEQPRRPDLVVIMAGTNDLGRNFQPPVVLDDLCQLHAACHARGVATLAVAPPPAPKALRGPFEEARRRLVALLAAWARAAPAVAAFLNAGELVPAAMGSHLWDPDGLHYSPAGSQLLGQRLASAVAQVLLPGHGSPQAPESVGSFFLGTP